MSTEITPSMRRSVLIAALRDPTTWPDKFKWFYGSCHSCAIGLLCGLRLVNADPADENTAISECERSAISEHLGLSPEQAKKLFWRCGADLESSFPPHGVTANMVADELEAMHRELEACAP